MSFFFLGLVSSHCIRKKEIANIKSITLVFLDLPGDAIFIAGARAGSSLLAKFSSVTNVLKGRIPCQENKKGIGWLCFFYIIMMLKMIF